MYHNDSNSTEGLKQLLLQLPRKNNNNINNTTDKDKDYNNSSSPSSSLFYLSISNPYKDIIHISANGEEYYHVELVCNEDSSIEYGIQAYGEEAKELYKEINRFTTTPSRYFYKGAEELVEKDDKRQQEEEDQEKFMLVKKAINYITDCNFDNGCLLIFKKLKNVCISKRKVMFD
jgi:hypothetical protein